MFFRGRDVAVVGGGNTALEDAMFLSNYCNKVYIIHRRDKLRGEEKIAKAISEKDNIEMVWNSNVVKLIGDDKVEGITVKNSVDGSEKDIQVSGLFIAVGQEPDNYDFEEVVELDAKVMLLQVRIAKQNQEEFLRLVIVEQRTSVSLQRRPATEQLQQ